MLLHISLEGSYDWATFAQHLWNTNSQNDVIYSTVYQNAIFVSLQ